MLNPGHAADWQGEMKRNIKPLENVVHEREIIRAVVSACANGAGSEHGIVDEEGIGDDCAVFAGPDPGEMRIALTTDTMIQDIHFSMNYFTPWFLGRKLAAVNLSDLAAQGAVPGRAFLNLGLPLRYRRSLLDFVLPFASGLCSGLHRFGAVLAGGDTVSTPGEIMLTLTLLGQVRRGRWLSRQGARPGDIVYCSGYLGESAAGFKIMSSARNVSARCGIPRTVSRRLGMKHLDPVPRVELGQILASSGLVTAGMDMSDGLATDLAHICEMSGTGAVVKESMVPVSRALRTACRSCPVLGSPLDLALYGGEDFELLWTVNPADKYALERKVVEYAGIHPFPLGRIVHGKGVELKSRHGSEYIGFRGYEH